MYLWRKKRQIAYNLIILSFTQNKFNFLLKIWLINYEIYTKKENL